MVSVERYPCFCYADLRRFESKEGDAVFSNVLMEHVPCSLLKKKTIVLWSATSWRLTKCLNQTTFLYMWLRGNLEFVVVQLHVKSRTSLFSVSRDGCRWQVQLLSVAHACQAKSKEKYEEEEEEEEEEERVETIAEVAACCRETEESDEMYKTTSIIWRWKIKQYRTVIFYS